jgi:hypothetical protein
MHLNLVGLAVCIVLLAGAKWLIEGLINRKEGPVAKIEYNDSKTSEQRKRELLARYADSIVDVPSEDFWMVARDREKLKKWSWGTRLFALICAAVVIGVIISVTKFIDYLVLLVFN